MQSNSTVIIGQIRMVYKVALVGHSQLPEIEDYDDVEFELLKIRGARIRTFEESNCFGRICSEEWDCVIIFLRGNDICDHHDAEQVVNDLSKSELVRSW